MISVWRASGDRSHTALTTPLVFSLLRAYHQGALPLNRLTAALKAIENFHFLHTAIASVSSSGGISMMYAAAARELYSMDDASTRTAHLQNFKRKLRERVPEESTFKAQFTDLRFSSSDTRQRPLVRYVLEKIDEHYRGDTNVDYDKMSIEHLAPEHPPVGVKKVNDAGSIGNLIFVSEDTNGKLKNKDFVAKKPILDKDHVPMDRVLDKAKAWTDAEIAARSNLLAKVAYKNIWKF